MKVPINKVSDKVLRNNCLSRLHCPLPRVIARITAIVAVVLLAMITVMCLAAPVSYIIGGVLGGIALAALATTIVSEVKKAGRHLPSAFLKLIGNTYPSVVYNLAVKENLTLLELRQVLTVLGAVRHEGDLVSRLSDLPEELVKKVLRFGVKNLEQGVLGVELPPLEPFLRKHCPFYALKTLIDMGDENICNSRGCATRYQGCYWLGAAALGGGNHILGLFDLRVPVIMKKFDKKNFELLKQREGSSSWNSQDVQKIIEDLAAKCEGDHPEISAGVQRLPLKKENISTVLSPHLRQVVKTKNITEAIDDMIKVTSNIE